MPQIYRHRDGEEYVINGRKWWTSGAMELSCQICVFMGKTDTNAARHRQQSMVLVPFNTPGVTGWILKLDTEILIWLDLSIEAFDCVW